MYIIKYLHEVVNNELPNIQINDRKKILKAISERLTVDPINLGEPLHRNLKGYRRIRVVNYRIIYKVIGNIVEIHHIDYRRDVYDWSP